MKRQIDDKQRDDELLTDLAAGELRGFAAWRLRGRIARDPELRREWVQIRSVWGQLAAKRAESAPDRPRWPAAVQEAQRDTITIGGRTMNRRMAFAACVALSLCTVTAGAYAGRKWLIDPFMDYRDSHNHVWRVVGHFKGQVKQYDADHNFFGSFGTDETDHKGIAAEVTIDDHTYRLSGAGFHPLKDSNGAVVGYAELAPETDKERSDGRAAYIKRQRVDEMLPMDFGSSDQQDGSQIGFFGDKREFKWTLTGDVDAKFTRTDSNRVVFHGTGRDLNAGHNTGGAGSSASSPTFTWVQNGETHSISGYGSSATLVLPTSIAVKVELERSSR